ncbi:MAG: hypothetical protein NC045_01295 [Bacteroides sp.]|nr:hypothetical protein [Bacteroides sp.]
MAYICGAKTGNQQAATMEIHLLTPEEYARTFNSHTPHVYNSVAFNEHNRHRADALHYLGFGDSSLRAGIILGERDGWLLSPFSAPFGGFTTRGQQSTGHIFQAVKALADYGRSCGKRIRITLPPAIYSPTLIGQQTAALTAVAHRVEANVNHHVELDFSAGNARSKFQQKGRNTLNMASRQGFELREVSLSDAEGLGRVYEIIEANHRLLDHPLRMTPEQIRSTAPLTGSMFLLMTRNGQNAAAAMINRTKQGVAQVIYWGDLLEMRPLHPMNLLAQEAMNLMKEKGFSVMDIGPSGEGGVPAPGLCRFKESVGCTVSVKFTFEL